MSAIRSVVPSTASDYQWSGYIEVDATVDHVRVRWEGETAWEQVEWWEILYFAGCKPIQVREDLQWDRERAYNDAFAETVDEQREIAARAAYNLGYQHARWTAHGERLGEIASRRRTFTLTPPAKR